ncbi:MAG TPA: hypothetical protein VFA26_02500 [Gemmataceae bacterium]|nr:hypothetical protein [Gemmataceae bacterium]
MKTSITMGAALAVALLAGGALRAEGVKSGPQVGQSCGAFEPKHVTGPDAGKAKCLV